MFDLDAHMAAIHAVLGADAALERVIRKQPGLRLPGAWDPFEVAVRAVVGQQVSVKGARTVIGRIAAKAGPLFASAPLPGVNRFFPTAHELNACQLGRIGMPAKRVATVQALAEAVVLERICFEIKSSLPDFVSQLTRIAGIGDWTAQYIAMRALGEPDAFPAADLGIAKALQQTGQPRPGPKQIRQRAESWRPWRAYAAIYLWNA
jgi:AraC family transcriptional regulator of adaptative response / DNA-3-methyladenine glycosylase II